MNTSPSLLEPLEPRIAPAGVIELTTSGGVLNITGDNEANQLRVVFDAANNEWDITGLSGTAVYFNGDLQAGVFSIPSQQGIKARMNGGDDQLMLYSSLPNNTWVLPKGLSISMGEGNDTFKLGEGFAQQFEIGGSTVIDLGAGHDTFTIESATRFSGSVKILGGSGNDNVTFKNTAAYVVFAKGLNIDMGTGGKIVTIDSPFFNVAGGTFSVKGTGEGADLLALNLNSKQTLIAGAFNHSFGIHGQLHFGSSPGQQLSFLGPVKVNGASGHEYVYFKGQVQFAKSAIFDLKGGLSEVLFVAGTEVQGTSLTIKTGSGDEFVRHETGSALYLSKALTLSLGDGVNSWTSAGTSLIAVQSIKYTGGAGNDTLTWNGAQVSTTGGISISLGGASEAGANNITFANSAFLRVGGSLSITGGSGMDTIVMPSPNIQIGGNLNLKLGGGENSTLLLGDFFQITGGVNYTGGTMNDTFRALNETFIALGAIKFDGGKGAGANVCSIAPLSGSIGGLQYKGGSGPDGVGLNGEGGPAISPLKVTGNVNISLGEGLSMVSFSSSHLYGSTKITSSSLDGQFQQLTLKQVQLNGSLTASYGKGDLLWAHPLTSRFRDRMVYFRGAR